MRAIHVLPRLALAAAPLLVAGGCDNVACVFGPGNCSGSGGGGGGTGQSATFPRDGAWILDGPPELQDFAPRGDDGHPDVVVPLFFSESIAPGSVAGAFELFNEILGFPISVLDPPPVIGDGRVVVLVPSQPLMPENSFLIRMREGAQVTDLTGQLLVRPVNGVLGSFVVPLEPPDEPRLIATWPPSDAVGQSDLGEILAFFDRKMSSASFGATSWITSVDGVPPASNPNPVPLLITGGQVPVTVSQVWRWRSVDSEGEPLSLGSGVSVEVVLSPEGSPLVAESGGELETTSFAFDLAPTPAPAAVRKHALAPPEDAIGEPNLSGSIPVLEIELGEAPQVGDELVLIFFGQGPEDGDPLQALLRTVTLETEDLLVDVFPDDVDLLASTAPPAGVLADGELVIAVRHERGGTSSAVRLADADATESGPQPFLFDVTAPTFVALGPEGDETSLYRSDVRGVVLSGRASELIRRAEVRLPDLGLDNGPEADVAAADDEGFFVARPVLDVGGDPLGIVLGNQAFSMQIYDRALNPAAGNVTGTFRQRGAVGPAELVPGDPVNVHVLDAVTLAPLEGAVVLSQREEGAVFDVDEEITTASGNAAVLSAPTGRTVITVELDGYSLFTFHGVRSERLDVPLDPALAPARTAGEVHADVPAADISPFTSFVTDSRARPGDERLFGVGICTPDPVASAIDCPFGPFLVTAERLGAQSLVTADFDVTFGTFSAAAFLKAFALAIPLRPIDPDGVESSGFELDDLLASEPAADQAVAVAEHVLTEPPRAQPGGFGTVEGAPVVTVEGVSAGLHGSVAVGLGAPFEDATPGSWTVLGAYAGAARGGGDPDTHGRLVAKKTLEPDLFVRAELTDEGGNRVGRRPRLSQTTGALDTPDLPVLRAPSGASGAPPYDLVVDQVLLDGHSTLQSGLYRVVLTDSAGRRWILWRTDEPGDADATLSIHVPAVGGLANGTISAQVSAWTWPDFDPAAFLWSDVEREHDVFAHTASVTYTQP